MAHEHPLGSGGVKALPSEFYANFLSSAAKGRKISAIRGLYVVEARPGMVSLLAGKPNASTFPITSLQFGARSPSDPDGPDTVLNLSTADLSAGLQYGPTAGYPPLVRWLMGLQAREHNRNEGEGWRISVGVGSQDLIKKAMTAILNPGESILAETPIYSGTLAILQGLHLDVVEVETDADGISVQSLRKTLDQWPKDKPKPKALYTVPYGGNPTGLTSTVERRREVLALAHTHDFIILEDDPYYYLYFGAAPRPPSYFTLELEHPVVGRVLRFESFSKIVSAGLRLGFVSGPEPFLNAMDMETAMSNLQPPGLTQSIAYTLFNHWGYDTFKQHTEQVSAFYRGKRDVFERALKKHLGGLAEWTTPEAGMFVWFKLLLSRDGDGECDSSQVVTRAIEHGVLALPGTVFLPDGRRTAYVRAAFSLLGEEDVDEACRRLRIAVLEARGEVDS